MRVILCLAAMLLLNLSAKADEKRPVAAQAPAGCILKNKEFCGVWKPSSGRDAAGKVTISGDRLSWENDDWADCTLIDEGERNGLRYSALRCIETYVAINETTLAFYLLHTRREPEGMFVARERRADCLFAGWYLMLMANDFRMSETGLACGNLSTAPYFRPNP